MLRGNCCGEIKPQKPGVIYVDVIFVDVIS